MNRYQNANNIAVDGGTHRLLRSNNATGEETDNTSSTSDDYDGSSGNPILELQNRTITFLERRVSGLTKII